MQKKSAISLEKIKKKGKMILNLVKLCSCGGVVARGLSVEFTVLARALLQYV